MGSFRLKRGETEEIRGEKFTIREWTTIERAEFFKRMKDDATLAGAYLAHKCVEGADGKPKWPKEVDAGSEPPEIIDGLLKEILKLCGVNPDEAAEPAADGAAPEKKH